PTELTPGGVRHWDGAGQWPETGRSARIADRAARPSLLGLLTNIGDRQSIGTSGMRRRLSILTPFCSHHARRHVDPPAAYPSCPSRVPWPGGRGPSAVGRGLTCEPMIANESS